MSCSRLECQTGCYQYDQFLVISISHFRPNLFSNTFCYTNAFFAENPDPQCGNGVVEGDEECDCGSSNPDVCKAADPCCKPGNCTLIEGAKAR